MSNNEFKGPKLCGKINEANIEIDSVKTKGPLDTGSCVSLLSKAFYDSHLTYIEIKPLRNILRIECADGNVLPYIGFIEVDITAIEGIPNLSSVPCIFLVTPNTNYSAHTPVLLGTKILDELKDNCKMIHGPKYLQTGNLQTPWYLTFRAMTIKDNNLLEIRTGLL